MSAPTFVVTIDGMEYLKRKLTYEKLFAKPTLHFLQKSILYMQTLSRRKINVFTGGNRDSILTEIDKGAIPQFAILGSNSVAIESIEFGSRPHFPNIDNITPWAEAHGWEPIDLALHIAAEGTQPHPFMMPTVVESIPVLQQYVYDMAVEIDMIAGGK